LANTLCSSLYPISSVRRASLKMNVLLLKVLQK
jgi:hypothetical protein